MKITKKINPILLNIIIIVFLVGLSVSFVIYSQFKREKESSLTNQDSQTLDGQIALYTEAIKANPDYIKSYIDLSQAYLQKVLITADVSYYVKIDELMDRAEKINPDFSDIYATRASVEIGRHNFKEGEKLVEKAITLNPNNHLYYGLLGDAQIELGKYKEAVSAFQKMVDLRPDYSSYVRIAYARELYADIAGAKEFLELAIDSGSNSKHNIAFAYVELGKLNMRDNLTLASEDFNNALRFVPDYPPALEGLGKVAFFNKNNLKAEEYFLRAYEKLPIVQYATDLGDLYLKNGDTKKASQHFTLAKIALDKSTKSGINTNLEYSIFLSERDLDLEKSLELGKQAYEASPSIYAADALSWAYYKNGDINKAATYTKETLRLGEFDPTILFHQGMIALKKGDTIQAKRFLSKSFELDPNFSILHADLLKQELNNLN